MQVSTNVTADARTKVPGRDAREAGDDPAHDDHEPPAYQAFIFQNAVVVAKRGHTRIEHPERGTTYAAPLPPETRQAAREVARRA